MSKSKGSSAVAVLVLVSAVAAWAQQVSLKPGQYQLSSEVQVPGRAEPVKTTRMSCLTPDQAKDFENQMMSNLTGTADCKVSNVEREAGKITFDSACNIGGEQVSGTSEMKHGPDWYEAVVRMQMSGAVSTSRFKAKRIGGVCTGK
jgi:Protein of unknown function (DUF3617)